jgi:hypothetical protein
LPSAPSGRFRRCIDRSDGKRRRLRAGRHLRRARSAKRDGAAPIGQQWTRAPFATASCSSSASTTCRAWSSSRFGQGCLRRVPDAGRTSSASRQAAHAVERSARLSPRAPAEGEEPRPDQTEGDDARWLQRFLEATLGSRNDGPRRGGDGRAERLAHAVRDDLRVMHRRDHGAEQARYTQQGAAFPGQQETAGCYEV